MVALLLALTAFQAAPNLVRLECEIPDRRARTEPMRLSMTMEVRGDRIASVLVDGPPIFSSFRRIRRGQGDEAFHPRLLPRNMQWRGSFQRHAIRLRRERADMVLEPVRDANGAYSGFWTYLAAVTPQRVELNGSIDCRTVAGTLNESAAS